jgi:hypothetical protein
MSLGLVHNSLVLPARFSFQKATGKPQLRIIQRNGIRYDYK